jgi:hypothetical protein
MNTFKISGAYGFIIKLYYGQFLDEFRGNN